jgi:Outer membrane protein beta-barrel domain
MKKLFLFSTLLTLLFVTNVHGEAQKYEHPARTSTSNLEKVKFGSHVHAGILGNKVGAFVEYEIHEAVGLQTGLLYFSDNYYMQGLEKKDKNAFVDLNYLSVPLIARFYPGEERQFCVFAGLQINYLRGGNLALVYKDASELIEHAFSGKSGSGSNKRRKIKDTNAHGLKISNWGSHFIVGFDYEYRGGFQLGLEYGWGLSNVVKCKETTLNWIFKPSLGYNFVKLFG